MSGDAIFLNYRRDDAEGFARALYDDLTRVYGDQVFRDLDAISPGTDYTARIAAALDQCQVAVVLIGPRWTTVTDTSGRRRLDDPGDLVTQEIAAALARRVRVLPVLLGSASMPASSQLPPSIRDLARLQALEVSDSRWAYDVDRLCAAIGPARPAAPAPPHFEPPPAGRGRKRRGLGVVVAILAVLVAGIAAVAVVMAVTRSNDQPPGTAPDTSSRLTFPNTTSRGNPRLNLTPSQGKGGQTVTAEATGFAANEPMQIFFQGQLVGQGDAGGDGSASIPFTVPKDFSVFVGDTLTVSAVGRTSVRSADALFTITG